MKQNIMNEEVKTQGEPKEEKMVKRVVKETVSKGKEFVKRNKWRVAGIGTAITGAVVVGVIKHRNSDADDQVDDYDTEDVTIIDLEPEYGYEEFDDTNPTGEEVIADENDTEEIAE